MSHRNHLSRRGLHAYGFKEGEPWADDRRALEAALWEIDQLERQTEYEYHRPFPSHHPGRPSAWRPPHGSGGHRSNSDSYPISESGMPNHARYIDDHRIPFDRYQGGYANPTYPSSHHVPHPASQSPMTARDYRPSPHYASPSRPSNYQGFRDCDGFSHSSSHPFVPSMAHSRTSSYGHHPQYSSQHPPAQQLISTPGQLQMVTRRSDRNESFSPNRDVDPRFALATPAPTMMSPRWSMDATEGTTRTGSMSSSSRGMYSQGYRDMEYASRGSGYGESFNIRPGSHEDFYGSDEEYISDGEASGDDAGYYSSDADPEEFLENDENFSEGSDDFYDENDGYEID